MGSRGRSVRLRIGLLVTVPLLALIGLVAYVAGTTINNYFNLHRVPALINNTSKPAAAFTTLLQAERFTAMVYAFNPSPANASAFAEATRKTQTGEVELLQALNSPATTDNESGTEPQGIAALKSQLSKLPGLESAVSHSQLTPMRIYGAYTEAIANEPRLFLDEAGTETNATTSGQALGLIGAISSQEALSQEQALLAGMLAAPKPTTAQQRAAFAQARAAFDIAAANRSAYLQDADFLLTPANQKIYNAPQADTSTLLQQLAKIETAVETGTPIAKLGVSAPLWQTMTDALLTAQTKGGYAEADAQLAADNKIAHSALIKFYVVSGIALAALLLTILFTTALGRSIIRRLRGLEQNALTLAEKQLPDVIGRLRRGDDVDVAAEAPPLRIGDDEIGRVGQAFDLVRQTAIRSAVEEAKLRRGLNDVFRSLARRSQSLLHRQLTLLDQMERRASDPEALDDLFRLDHLTTRMRRHAEGLVILAGAPPGRGWSSPVRMVDVMRGAIAEVEDYARVSVATRSQAALAGSAVADVIHLLAELIENATTLSPPYTSVRVSGDTVANGFAIAVEDRGLGMSMQRIGELNERLAHPPEFNPADSEQLGLFVVGQLARRHGIKVTLKSSPYGGTEAVVLVPRHLVVAEEAFRAGLPGEAAPALPGDRAAALPGSSVSPGAASPGSVSPGSVSPGAASLGATALPGAAITVGSDPGQAEVLESATSRLVPFDAQSQLLDAPLTSGGPRIAGPLRRAQSGLPDGTPRGGHHAPPRGTNGNGLADGNGPGSGPGPGLGGRDGLTGGSGADGFGTGGFAGPAGPELLDGGELPRRTRTGPGRAGTGAGAQAGPAGPASFDVFSRVRDGASEPPSAPYQNAFSSQPPLPGWPGQNGPPAPAARPDLVTPVTPAAPPVSPFTSAPGGGTGSRPPWELSHEADADPELVVPAEVTPMPPDGEGQADGDFEGLPRRVKQASIAPQLRGDPAGRRRTGSAETGSNTTANGPTPEEIRATMSALQRGWQEGRSQRGGGEPPWQQNTEHQNTGGDPDAT